MRCWQHTDTIAAGSAVPAATWTELPALQSAAVGDEGASSSGVVQHLWLASQSPPLLGTRLDEGRIILYDLDRSVPHMNRPLSRLLGSDRPSGSGGVGAMLCMGLQPSYWLARRHEQVCDMVLEGCCSFYTALPMRSAAGQHALLGVAHLFPPAATVRSSIAVVHLH